MFQSLFRKKQTDTRDVIKRLERYALPDGILDQLESFETNIRGYDDCFKLQRLVLADQDNS